MLQTITVKALDGSTDVSFDLANAGATKVVYQDATSDLREPRLLTVSHALKGVGAKGSDRHTVNTQDVRLDDESNPNVLGISTTITVPRSSVITPAIIAEAIVQHRNVLGLSGFTDALVAGRFA